MLWVFIVGFLLICTAGGVFFAVQYGVQQTADAPPEGTKTTTIYGEELRSITQADVEFTLRAGASSDAQDSDDDVDVDLFEWDESKNADLKSKGILDTTGATPLVMNVTGMTVFHLNEENKFPINAYKFLQSYTAGNTETNIAKYLKQIQADMSVQQASSGTQDITLIPGKVYLATVTEAAAADSRDVVPYGFLFTVTDKSALGEDVVSNIISGTQNLRIEDTYYSGAANHSQISVRGKCEDDEDNSVNLDSTLDGLVDSSLTTATTIAVDCDVILTIDKDWYWEPMVNPLAPSNSERGYLKVWPYVENDDDAASVAYGRNQTGDVGYSASDSASAQFLYEGMDVCGEVITSDSSTDAAIKAAENIYEPGCFPGYKEWRDEDAKFTVPFLISEVKVDYDLAAAGTDETFSGSGGGTGEDFLEINLVSPMDSTFVMNQTVTG